MAIQAGQSPLFKDERNPPIAPAGGGRPWPSCTSAIVNAQLFKITWSGTKTRQWRWTELWLFQSEQNNEYFLHHRRSGRNHCSRWISWTACLTYWLRREMRTFSPAAETFANQRPSTAQPSYITLSNPSKIRGRGFQCFCGARTDFCRPLCTNHAGPTPDHARYHSSHAISKGFHHGSQNT